MNSLRQLAGKITFSTHAPNTHTYRQTHTLSLTHHEDFVVSNLLQFSPYLPTTTTTTTTTAGETTVKKFSAKKKSKQENLPQLPPISLSVFTLPPLPSHHKATLQISAILHAAQRAANIKINIKNKLELPAAFINF